jgi:hypothetical protein
MFLNRCRSNRTKNLGATEDRADARKNMRAGDEIGDLF